MTPGEELRIRIVRRRVVDCRRRLEVRLNGCDATFRSDMDDAALDRWFDDERRLKAAVATIEENLVALDAGDLGWNLWPIRQAHCSFAGCDRPRRRHFGRRVLQVYPLAWPPNVCRSCGYEAEPGTNLELDHLAELVWGGADAVYNLIRVCHVCHRAKEIYPDELPSVARIFALVDYGVTGRLAA